MKIRRVVTGHSGQGMAVVASDTLVEGFRPALSPGQEFHMLWGADEAPTYPDHGAALPFHDWFPPVGGFRFLSATMPPDTCAPLPTADMAAATAELEAAAPGLLATMEPDAPGMHTTDTIDVIYVISGEIVLELDDAAKVTVRAGETIVQSGTRHAWRNPGSEPCRLIAVQIGAHRSS